MDMVYRAIPGPRTTDGPALDLLGPVVELAVHHDALHRHSDGHRAVVGD